MICSLAGATPVATPSLPTMTPLSFAELLQRFLPLAPEAPPPPGTLPFIPALYGFVRPAVSALRARLLPPVGYELDWIAVERDCLTHLGEQLHRLCRRTLVLELNVARLRELLRGDTPEQRFQDYTRRILQDPAAWAELAAEYKVLAQQLAAAIERWTRVWCELFCSLTADFAQVATLLQPALQRPTLVAVKGGLSDPHRGGRGVFHLTFQDAGATPQQARVVYKPRSLTVDAHFQQLLAACNQAAACGTLSLRGLRYAAPPLLGCEFPRFRTLRSIDCGDHGWVEFVAAAPCQSPEEVARFYARQGGFLALLHLLDGADLHHENIIAHGEHPMLVDLEMLFHPWTGPAPAAGARERAEALLRESVMRTMLLPGRSWGDRERAGVNLGGLGNGGEQPVPQPVSCWADAGTDEMRLATGPGSLPPGDNLPRLNGAVAPVSHHAEAVVAGFEAVLRLVLSERERWLTPDGPLWAFAHDEVRRLVRPTVVYAEILDVLTHPDHQRERLAREQLIAVLTDVPTVPALPPWALEVERTDLEQGDVPLFLSRPASTLLADSRGVKAAGYLDEPALAAVLRRVATLDERAVGQQVFIIRAALAVAGLSLGVTAPTAPLAHRPVEPSLGGAPALPPPGAAAVAAHDQLAAAARAAAVDSAPRRAGAAGDDAASAGSGDGAGELAGEVDWAPRWLAERLSRDAVRGELDVSWIGAMAISETASELAPLHPDLYDGTAGVALFLGYLGRLSGEARYLELAQRAGRALHAGLLAQKPGAPLGGFGGLPSQLYALLHLQAVLGDRGLLSTLDDALRIIAAELDRDERLDVMYGAAGALLVLLTAHEMTRAEAPLAVAVACGRHLAAKARRGAAGACWPVQVATQPLLGFAHGAAGIAAALARLARLVADHDEFGAEAAGFLGLAREALAFERASYDAARGWPDLRQAPAQYPLAWCHGAPGVALGRLPLLDLDPQARTEVAEAITRTLAAPPLLGHGLCHGQLGNLVIADEAARRLGRADLAAQVQHKGRAVLQVLHRSGPRGSLAFAAAAPGLMDGLAGVGLGLLRLAYPDKVPLVQALAAGPPG